ncbi:cobalamin-binding protein [Hymenobacter coccineus]|uniref:Cobalamin-binding protein n=1 Tax=Hymenobacter coccineus TaxID=1908235 RepID=A0A1G1TK46_9BACT|nr:cobalamin-binding protein [Hymenobacter coccineus]
MGRRVAVPFPPQRIVSLVPSQTELLFDLGLGARVVGVTKFCIHPSAARQQATVVGGTKNFDFAKVAACQPDLIIGNKEENYQEGIEQLAAQYPVWLSDVADLPGAQRMIKQVGLITGRAPAAAALATDVAARFGALSAVGPPEPVAYLIWRKPYMAAATGTFINDLLARAGFANVFGALGRYPEIAPEQLARAAPQRILLSSEPYPFKEKHIAELQQICPLARIQLVDGELFSWYGSRLLHAADYLNQLH